MTGWLFEALVASTLLMVVVLAIRAPVRRAFGAQIAYALWALPALRLLLPPLPADWREQAAMPIARASETFTVLIVDPAGPVAPAAAPVAAATSLPALGTMLAMAWAAGAVLFLGWHLVAHLRFCRRIVARGVPVETVDGIRIIASDAAPGPLAFGVLRRHVAFPTDFAARYDADERALALAHELGHHRRGDLIANWVALGVLALHWCNPLAWRAFRVFRADQELANDARVLAGRSIVDRHAYACAIVKAAHGGVVSPACHLHTVNDLKGRLRMLTISRTSRLRLFSGGAAVSALVVGGLALTASGTRAAAALTERVGIGVVELQATPPTPPTPPAPPVRARQAGPAAVAPLPPTTPPAPPVPPAAEGDYSWTDASGTHHVIVRKSAPRDEAVSTADPLERRGLRARPFPRVTMMRRLGPDGTRFPSGEFGGMTIRSERCGPGEDLTTQDKAVGDKRVVILCMDRMDRLANGGDVAGLRGAEIAARSQRRAMQMALVSLGGSRRQLEANPQLDATQRREALAQIDSAIAEMKAELADIDER